MDRLMTALQIDNREAAHSESDAIAKIKSVVIRSPMADRIVHAGEQFAVDLRAITTNNACYATHLNLIMKSKPEDAETTGYERPAREISCTHDFLIVLA